MSEEATDRDRTIARWVVSQARRVLEHEMDRLSEWAPNLTEGAEREGFEKAIRMLRHMLVPSQQGCVVTVFDDRWIEFHPSLMADPIFVIGEDT